MSDSREDRIARLSQRFKTHGAGRPATTERRRERKSLYLDGELLQRLDQVHGDVDHELYRQGGVTKSVFLEALLEYGLAHLEEIKQGLTARPDGSEPS